MVTYESEDLIGERDMDALLEPYRLAVERSLKDLGGPEDQLGRLASEFIEGGGKRLRPVITLLVSDALSGSYADAIPISIAYELAHTASLTQDDIIDNSPTRHNRPTAHTRHGVTTAILLSDMMIFSIFDRLADYGDMNLPRGSLISLIRYLAQAARQAAEGEYLEMELSKKTDSTVDDYLRLVELKTGALFGAAAASGAIVGGGKQNVVRDMYDFGINLGIAFQMVDDILDMTGTTREMGKPMLKDLQNNAANIVLVHALQHADPHQKGSIVSMMAKRDFGLVDINDLLGIFDDLGSVEYASRQGRIHAARARAKLRGLPKSGSRQTLESLTHWLEYRRR